jgi:hypothetical protein
MPTVRVTWYPGTDGVSPVRSLKLCSRLISKLTTSLSWVVRSQLGCEIQNCVARSV